MISAWGIDHGPDVVSKRERKASSGSASGGRAAAAYFVPGIHGAVAGHKGKKWHAAGTELGSQIGGAQAGMLANRALKGRAAVLPLAGGVAGSITGTQFANRRGWYKSQG